MKVVFVQDVPQVGKAGDVKEVANGYGRNFLLPRGLAVLATRSTLKELENRRQGETKRQARLEAEAGAWVQRLEGLSLTFKARVGEKERLYGSITNADIAKEIKAQTGYQVDKKRIELEEPIHRAGSYEVTIRLSKDATAKVQVIVEGEKA